MLLPSEASTAYGLTCIHAWLLNSDVAPTQGGCFYKPLKAVHGGGENVHQRFLGESHESPRTLSECSLHVCSYEHIHISMSMHTQNHAPDVKIEPRDLFNLYYFISVWVSRHIFSYLEPGLDTVLVFFFSSIWFFLENSILWLYLYL